MRYAISPLSTGVALPIYVVDECFQHIKKSLGDNRKVMPRSEKHPQKEAEILGIFSNVIRDTMIVMLGAYGLSNVLPYKNSLEKLAPQKLPKTILEKIQFNIQATGLSLLGEELSNNIEKWSGTKIGKSAIFPILAKIYSDLCRQSPDKATQFFLSLMSVKIGRMLRSSISAQLDE